MNISDKLKNELKALCQRIAKLLSVQQGSVEIRYHKGQVKDVFIPKERIKFEENK